MKNTLKIGVLSLIIFLQLESAISQDYMNHIFGFTTEQTTVGNNANRVQMMCNAPFGNRTFDGRCNNLITADLGTANSDFSRRATAFYADNNCGMIDRGNPREISNLLFDQTTSIPDSRGLSGFVYTWLQFIDHDLTLTPVGTEAADIPVPQGDPFFDPTGSGTRVIPFTRSVRNQCAQKNDITHWLDASMVYGSSEGRANWLRTFALGKLKTSSSQNGDLLPCNTVDGSCNGNIDTNAPAMDGDKNQTVRVFVAGDFRANEQPGLTALHTLFVREHNRICDVLVANGMTNDEAIYQRARKIIGAEIQAITYNEIFPALGLKLDPYGGYDETINPSILNEFSVAAYRLGHTMVPSTIRLMDGLCNEIQVSVTCTGIDGPCPATYDGEILLREGFFNPSIIASAGIAPILNGLSKQTQESVDRFVIDDLRNFLFGPPGAGGLDLVSLNLQRGRDHGLPDYNSIRQSFGLPAVTNFSDFAGDQTTRATLELAYPDINNIDAWAGMLAENPLPGSSIGPTIHAVLKQQFEALRDADRLWYQIDPAFTAGDKSQLASTRLEDIIRNNTGESAEDLTTSSSCPEGYCIPDYTGMTSNCYTFISRVAINDLENSTTATANTGGGYNDFAGQSTRLMRNASYTLEVDYATCNDNTDQVDTRIGVWIDWNGDGVFDTNEEIVDDKIWYNMSSPYNTAANPYSRTYTITVPDDAVEKPIRLRVRTNFHANNNYEACTNYLRNYNGGDTEDYTLVISDSYCTPRYTDNNCEGYISGVQLEGISNLQTNSSSYAGSAQNFDDLCATLTPGETYTGSVNISTCNIVGGNVELGIWIDWNNNSLFESNESIYDSNIDGTDGVEALVPGTPYILNYNFTVPANAALGGTRLRIRSINQQAGLSRINPCTEYGWGETEDYCINIMPTYCAPSYTAPTCKGYIAGVDIGDFTNTTTDGQATNGYSLENNCIDLEAGLNHDVVVTVTTCLKQDFDMGVWLDLNHNGTFEPAENFYDSNPSNICLNANESRDVAITLNIPQNAMLGETRLRVRTRVPWSSSVDPCVNYSGGETEDYCINIISCTTQITAIDGPLQVQQNANSITYSLPENDLDATYTWTVPQGATINSGQNSSSISVNYGATGGRVTVEKEIPGCGIATEFVNVTIIGGPCMAMPDVCGVKGSIVEIPVTVAEFDNINGFQFGVEWDVSVAEFVEITDFALTGMLVDNPTGGKLSVTWNDVLNPQSLSDGATVFIIRYRITGNLGGSTPLNLAADPPLEFTSGFNVAMDVCVNFGTLCVSNNLRVSGVICTPDGRSLTETRMMATEMGDGDEMSTVPNPLNYRLANLDEGSDFMLAPMDSSETNKCSVLDVIYAKYHIVGLLPFESPYQYIAADVNGSGTVTVLDAVYMQYVITGLLDDFPLGSYSFICNDQPPTLENPFDFNQSYMEYNLDQSRFGLDFVAVEIGDVSGASGGMTPTLRTTAVTLKTPAIQTQEDEIIRVPITLESFNDIAGFQFSLEWDNSVIEYEGFVSTDNVVLEESNFNLTNLSSGQLGVVWADETLSGLSIPDDEVLFEVVFKVTGRKGASTPLSINSSLVPTEIVSQSLAYLPLDTEEGSVDIDLLNTVVSTEDVTGIKVYPNPVLDDITTAQFNLSQAGGYKLELVNVLGQTVWSVSGHSSKGTQYLDIDLSDFSNGLYFLKMENGKTLEQIELVITR